MGNMDPNFFHTYATVEGSGSSSDNIVNKPGKYSLDQPEEEPKQMDTDDEKIEVDQICRGCLSMANVHNMQEIFIGGINSVVLYENVSQIKVESENVPAVLCINCTLELEKVDTFIKTLKHSYKVLAKAIEEINRLDKQNVNKYHLKRISILKNALLKGKFSGNFEAKEEANEDHQQLFEAWSEHSADDNFSIHNNSGSSDDEIPLSKRFNTNIKNKQPDTTKTKRINNEETLTKNKKSKDNLENLPDNDSFQLKEVLKCPICSKKIKNYEKHLHSNHHLDWDNSRCLKCPYQNAEKDELLEHSKKCKKSHCKNRALKIEDLELEEKLDSDDSDPEFQAFLKEMKLEDWESKINRSNKNRRPRKKFTCVKCPNVSFRQYKNIESHLKTVHNEESECIICEQEFTNSFSVLHHMMVKHGKLKCCRLCLVSFNNSEELNAHYKSEEHNTKCTVCGEQFKNRKALYEHRRKKHLNPHLENQKYKCPECPKEFANHNNIRRHIMIAHNDVRFLCDTCGQSYTTKRNLRLHILKFHEGVKLQNKNTKKNFFCEACGRELKIFHKYAIAMHRAKHKGHNFVCKICYDSFPTEEVFRRHVEDFGHQLFHCHKCPAEFVRQENYKVHLKNHDVPGWNKNMFATWGKSAKLRNDKGQFVCSYCPKVFKDKQRLDNHIRVHTNERPYKCHICSKGFKTWIHRKTHLNIHLGIKKWVCKYCGKAFTNSCTLKGHEMIHTGERPHRCPECKKGFITMSAMKKHRMVHFRTTASSYGKKDKPNPRDEDKSDSEHEENAEFVYKYESMFAGSEVSYENFAEPPKEVVVPMERELSCRANCI